jgi:hypothetical protein
MTRLLAAFAMLLAVPATAAAGPAYTAVPGDHSADPRFVVTYEGTGKWRTRFHATPPNPDEDPDTNDARDSSAQAWKLKFRRGLEVPDCAAGGCGAVTGVRGASGATRATMRIDHKHVDGIYPELDRVVRCRLARSTKPGRRLRAAVDMRYDPAADAFAVTAQSPLFNVLTALPTVCPKQGDSIDRILDTYAIPGFSFADGYGPERWFTSRTIAIPSALFHDSTEIRVRLAETKRGTPPRHCALENPSYERCTTRGSWSGVLTFRRR